MYIELVCVCHSAIVVLACWIATMPVFTTFHLIYLPFKQSEANTVYYLLQVRQGEVDDENVSQLSGEIVGSDK